LKDSVFPECGSSSVVILSPWSSLFRTEIFKPIWVLVSHLTSLNIQTICPYFRHIWRTYWKGYRRWQDINLNLFTDILKTITACYDTS
jgi:hypothetical protein